VMDQKRGVAMGLTEAGSSSRSIFGGLICSFVSVCFVLCNCCECSGGFMIVKCVGVDDVCLQVARVRRLHFYFRLGGLTPLNHHLHVKPWNDSFQA